MPQPQNRKLRVRKSDGGTCHRCRADINTGDQYLTLLGTGTLCGKCAAEVAELAGGGQGGAAGNLQGRVIRSTKPMS